MLNREEPRFLLSLRMWGEVNCSRFTTVGKVGTGATVLVCQGEGNQSNLHTYGTYTARERERERKRKRQGGGTYWVSWHMSCMWRKIGVVFVGSIGSIERGCGHDCGVSVVGL